MRTKEEIAALKAQMDPTEWESLAKWGLEPGGDNEDFHARAVAEYDRNQAVERCDLSFLATIFGKQASFRAANKLSLEQPAEYKRLRALAVKHGLCLS
jgi:hypothetical protein